MLEDAMIAPVNLVLFRSVGDFFCSGFSLKTFCKLVESGKAQSVVAERYAKSLRCVHITNKNTLRDSDWIFNFFQKLRELPYWFSEASRSGRARACDRSRMRDATSFWHCVLLWKSLFLYSLHGSRPDSGGLFILLISEDIRPLLGRYLLFYPTKMYKCLIF